MELVLHAASVHVHPASRARHERVRAILDAAGVAYTVSDTLEAPRETIVDGAELPRLAVRRPALDIVFASYENIVDWNDAGTIAAHLHETTAHARATDKEIFKENMRLREQIARLEAALRERSDGQRGAAPSAAPSVAPSSAPSAGRGEQKLRDAAQEAIAASEAAEREVDAARAREAKLRAALRALTQMVPTLMQIAGVLAE